MQTPLAFMGNLPISLCAIPISIRTKCIIPIFLKVLISLLKSLFSIWYTIPTHTTIATIPKHIIIEEKHQDEKNQTTLAFMLKLSKQWVFDDSFLIDTYFGVGYGLGADDNEGLPYGFLVTPDEFPISLT